MKKDSYYAGEQWKDIEHDNRYQVSNFGRFRKKLKNGYRYLTPFKKYNLYLVKIKDKDMNCARLVADAFIKKLNRNDRVYHINKNNSDNFYRNLKVLSIQELGKLTGPKSKSKSVVLLKGNVIIKTWQSARKAAKDLYISYQTVMDYCNRKVQKPMYKLMWEEDYFEGW